MRKKEEKTMMSRIAQRADNINIPVYMQKKMGFSDNWQNNISSKDKKMVVQVACRLQSVLRKLSKN